MTLVFWFLAAVVLVALVVTAVAGRREDFETAERALVVAKVATFLYVCFLILVVFSRSVG